MPVYGPPEKELNQGDLIAEVPFVKRRLHDVVLVPPLLGLITSNSCDIDKYEEQHDSLTRNQRLAFPLTLAPVYGLGQLDAGSAGDVRSHRHRRFFYLPAADGHPECLADIWMQQPVSLELVRRLPRVATLDREWLARLWLHLFVMFTRREPEDVFIGGQLNAP